MSQLIQKFITAIEDNATHNDYQVRLNYSGRFMYGRTCLGIVTGDNMANVTLTLADIIDEIAEDKDEKTQLRTLIKQVRQDNMGLDFIYYFPDISCATLTDVV